MFSITECGIPDVHVHEQTPIDYLHMAPLKCEANLIKASNNIIYKLTN